MPREIPSAPEPQEIPAKKNRTARSGPEMSSFKVSLRTVTPVLGGAARTREVDGVDVIRVPTVRGHLRFWWRCLYGHEYKTPKDLYRAESELWGKAADDGGGRSKVEVRVRIKKRGSTDTNDITFSYPGSYALWPARAERRNNIDAAPRKKGIHFELEVKTPKAEEKKIRNTVKAWILFGGYGSRTRRGLGSLTVNKDREKWLPNVKGNLTQDALAQAICNLFMADIFEEIEKEGTDLPLLRGAEFHVKLERPQDAVNAWTTALGWLREFRQGPGRGDGFARRPGPNGRAYPSISNWPEPDKIRHLTHRTQVHHPRYNADPAWPRGGFGLPIAFRFRGRDEPRPTTLLWKNGGKEYDRLASSLIVKALPLANGKYLPCALWLNRAYPRGRLFLKGIRNSEADFDRLLGNGDTPRFRYLSEPSLQDAFFSWLEEKHETVRL